jgi:hypothetical protein
MDSGETPKSTGFTAALRWLKTDTQNRRVPEKTKEDGLGKDKPEGRLTTHTSVLLTTIFVL